MPSTPHDIVFLTAKVKIRRFQDKYPTGVLGNAGIHDLRVLTKKLRGYLCVYPASCEGSVSECEKQLKLLADAYAELRDSNVLKETAEKIIRDLSAKQKERYIPLIKLLETQERFTQSHNTSPPDPAHALDGVIAAWPVIDLSVKQLNQGLQSLYAKAQHKGEKAINCKDNRIYHQWRKWAKYWLYCVSDLSSKSLPKHYKRNLDKLGETLGDLHDLSMLAAAVENRNLIDIDPTVIHRFQKRLSKQQKICRRTSAKRYKKLFKLEFSTFIQ